MKRMNKFMAIMIVAAVATIGTPQAFGRSGVALGDRTGVALGDRSGVALGDRSGVALGDYTRIAIGQLAAGIIMTD